jgi:hypothetical protein
MTKILVYLNFITVLLHGSEHNLFWAERSIRSAVVSKTSGLCSFFVVLGPSISFYLLSMVVNYGISCPM